MKRLLKIALISAFMTTSGFAMVTFETKSFLLKNTNIISGHTLKLTQTTYNAGTIKKVADENDNTESAATLASVDDIDKYIYNMYLFGEQTDLPDNFSTTMKVLVGDGTFDAADVYEITQRGVIDSSVTLSNVNAYEEPVIESLAHQAELNDETIWVNTRVFNLTVPSGGGFQYFNAS